MSKLYVPDTVDYYCGPERSFPQANGSDFRGCVAVPVSGAWGPNSMSVVAAQKRYPNGRVSGIPNTPLSGYRVVGASVESWSLADPSSRVFIVPHSAFLGTLLQYGFVPNRPMTGVSFVWVCQGANMTLTQVGSALHVKAKKSKPPAPPVAYLPKEDLVAGVVYSYGKSRNLRLFVGWSPRKSQTLWLDLGKGSDALKTAGVTNREVRQIESTPRAVSAEGYIPLTKELLKNLYLHTNLSWEWGDELQSCLTDTCRTSYLVLREPGESVRGSLSDDFIESLRKSYLQNRALLIRYTRYLSPFFAFHL